MCVCVCVRACVSLCVCVCVRKGGGGNSGAHRHIPMIDGAMNDTVLNIGLPEVMSSSILQADLRADTDDGLEHGMLDLTGRLNAI